MSALLNPAQREAIRYLDGPCLVIAGAGSGKTRVITHKILHLIDSGIAPRHIAAITFTNKAAQEMAERLGTMRKLPGDNKPVVSTFHSLGVQILRRDGKSLGLKRGFSILDADDAQGIIQEAMASTDRKLIRHAAARISLWKNALVEPERAAAEAANAQEHQIARAYAEYAATLDAYQAVDFDDLIRLPARLFDQHPDVLKVWRERLRYLLVDEYQDTNACQYALLKQLAGPRAAFTAVGDDDQSIYGWRGATLENLRQLGVDFPQLRVIKLEQNYRSTLSILNAANHLIQLNPKLYPKSLWSQHGVGDPIRVLACDDDEQEAEAVVARLQAHKFEHRTLFADYAILYRGNHQARVIEQALRKEKIPYVLSGGQSFFDRAEIRDLIAYLRLLVNDDDDPAFIRAITTPKRGVGASTLQALGQYAGQRQVSMFAAVFETGLESRLAARQLESLRQFGEFINRIGWRAAREPAAQVIDDLIEAIEYRAHLFSVHEEKVAVARWKNVTDFIDWLKKRAEPDDESPVGKPGADSAKGSTLLELAQSVALLTQLDRKDSDVDSVRMTTIHASKGLEFPHVFIVGCEEGLLPHRGDETIEDVAEQPAADGDAPADPHPERTQEERRLMYVAVTRAERSLTLSWCRQRKRARDVVEREPSRFIAEMKLSAQPESRTMISDDDARQRLARLRAMLNKPTAGA
ncbi:MAG: UvrD-helicase domain-containing protein [Burkholderiaceae bacterium]